jgi:hypothetical protein
MLADKGLDLVSSAINGGAGKAKEFIEEKTGIELDVKKGLTDEQVVELKKFEVSNELELKRLALADKQENNRHDEVSTNNVLLDKQNARGAASALGPVQTEVANKIYTQSAWTIPLMLVLNALLIMLAVPLHLDTTAVVAIGNLLGIALNNAYRERQSIIEFLFGTSIDKKDK